MRGPENTFIAAVHRHLPEGLYRLKNHNQFNGGIADCWYSGKRDLWVEYKFVVLPKRGSTVIDLVGGTNPPLSPLQQAWLREREAEGRNVWVIVGCREGGVILPTAADWATPMRAEFFKHQLDTRKGVAQRIANFVYPL